MTENYIIDFVVRGILSKIIVGVLTLISIVLTFSESYLFILFFFIGITFLSSFSGVLIDTKNNRYRSYLSVLGYKTGKYHPLTRLEHIVVRDVIFKITLPHKETYSTDDNYEVSLAYQGQLKIVLFYSYDKEDTIEFAKKLKSKFDCEIKDISREKIMLTNK